MNVSTDLPPASLSRRRDELVRLGFAASLVDALIGTPPVAEGVWDALTDMKRSVRATRARDVVARWMEANGGVAPSDELDVDRDVLRLFRAVDALKLGVLVLGRKGHPTRLRWPEREDVPWTATGGQPVLKREGPLWAAMGGLSDVAGEALSHRLAGLNGDGGATNPALRESLFRALGQMGFGSGAHKWFRADRADEDSMAELAGLLGRLAGAHRLHELLLGPDRHASLVLPRRLTEGEAETIVRFVREQARGGVEGRTQEKWWGARTVELDMYLATEAIQEAREMARRWRPRGAWRFGSDLGAEAERLLGIDGQVAVAVAGLVVARFLLMVEDCVVATGLEGSCPALEVAPGGFPLGTLGLRGAWDDLRVSGGEALGKLLGTLAASQPYARVHWDWLPLMDRLQPAYPLAGAWELVERRAFVLKEAGRPLSALAELAYHLSGVLPREQRVVHVLLSAAPRMAVLQSRAFESFVGQARAGLGPWAPLVGDVRAH